MADNKLNVEIGATTKGLEKGLATAIKDLNKFKTEQKKLEDQFKKGLITEEKYYNSLAKNSVKLQRAGAAVNSYKSKIGGLGKTASANATPALQEFSRVIQDAPYGIQGVANNITQLTSQFGYLSQKTGGAGAALKSMVSSMVGPAGILFAISAITSLWVSYEKEIKAVLGTSSALAKAQAEHVAQVKSEITSLETLLRIAQDESESKKVRQGAIDEINKNYEKYLGNLDLESVKTDSVRKSVEMLTLSLVQNAKVAGLKSLIEEKQGEYAEDIINAELKKAKALKVLNNEVDEAISGNSYLNRIIGNVKGSNARLKAFSDLTKRQDDVGMSARNLSSGVIVALDAYKEASKEVNEFNSELEKGLKPLSELNDKYERTKLALAGSIGNVDENAVFITAKSTSDNKTDKATLKSKTKLFDQIAAEQIKADETARNEFIKQWSSIDIDAVNPFAGMSEEINAGFNKIILDYQGFAEQTDIISSAIENTAKNIGMAIGNALASGDDVLQAAAGALVQGLGGMLSAMGDYLIKAGTAAVMAGLIVKLFGTISGIGAGFAAIAGGIALNAAGSAFSGVGAGLEESSGLGSGVAGGGSSSNSYRGSSGGGGVASGGGTYVFEIAGTKLVGVLQNTLDRNRNLGGTNRLSFSG